MRPDVCWDVSILEAKSASTKKRDALHSQKQSRALFDQKSSQSIYLQLQNGKPAPDPDITLSDSHFPRAEES